MSRDVRDEAAAIRFGALLDAAIVAGLLVEVAQVLKVTPATVRRWVTGQHGYDYYRFDVNMVPPLAKLVGTDSYTLCAYLFGNVHLDFVTEIEAAMLAKLETVTA